MSAPDLRKPALVTGEFRARIAELLSPLGFEPRAKAMALVRKRGKNVHRVEFGSSHYNQPGDAVMNPALTFQHAATRKLMAGWQAGGPLGGPAFALELPNNVADADQADALTNLLLERLAFFDWLEDPRAVLRDVSRRYVPGFIDPVLIVPYLRSELGDDAALSYTTALLRGRPELTPAFSTEFEADQPGDPASGRSDILLDHGSQLARALRAHVAGARPDVPSDVVPSVVRTARHFRCFLGRQLRAWGESEAAHLLRRAGDDAVAQVGTAQKAVDGPLVDSAAAARLALALATGTDRAPRRQSPEPRYFQYHPLHTTPFEVP